MNRVPELNMNVYIQNRHVRLCKNSNKEVSLMDHFNTFVDITLGNVLYIVTIVTD